ncbi:MAG: polysaccharide deacetylase family protein [Oscillospiraceae bacterium]|nr:polysaccharide deacetylase family protein [Oscillospiraceae bacterium]
MFFSFRFDKKAKKRLAVAGGAVFCGALLLTVSMTVWQLNRTVGCSAADLETALMPTAAADSETDAEPEDTQPKVAYLTFDDGPSKITEQVLDQLKKEDVKASFFVIAAPNNENYLPVLTRTVAEGHCIALHSCSHEYKDIYQSPEAYWADIDALKEKLKPYLGENMPDRLRFPGGSTNTVSHKYGGDSIMKTLKAQAEEKGYHYVDWNACADDAVGGHPSAETIARNVIRDCKEQSTVVILMHDTKNNKNTAEALPTIIGWLKENGYSFDTVDHLEKQI